MADGQKQMSFWDHLEELRGTLFRSVLALCAAAVLCFCFKDLLFRFVLGPARPDFFIYRLFHVDFSLQLVNIEVTAQFLTHLKVAFILGFILAFPYIVYEIWRFVAPGLYEREKRVVRPVIGASFLLFYVGVAAGYCLIFPLALHFFQQYSVSDMVTNTIALKSYVSLFFSMILLVGLLFDFPVVIWLLSSLGIVDRGMLRKYRRHALVVVVFFGVLITSDPFSLAVVTLLLYALYEVSILVCREAKQTEEDDIDR